MTEQVNADQQAKADADKAAEQMENDIDLTTLEKERDAEVLKGHLNTTVEQKKHWREKAKKQQEEFDAYKAAHPEKKDEKPVKKQEKQGDFDPDLLRTELRDELRVEMKYPDITEVEMSKARALAKAEGKPLSEIVADDYFQSYMKVTREKLAADKARPSPSNRGGNGGAGSVDDLKDAAKLSSMDNETFAKLSEQAGKRK